MKNSFRWKIALSITLPLLFTTTYAAAETPVIYPDASEIQYLPIVGEN